MLPQNLAFYEANRRRGRLFRQRTQNEVGAFRHNPRILHQAYPGSMTQVEKSLTGG